MAATFEIPSTAPLYRGTKAILQFTMTVNGSLAGATCKFTMRRSDAQLDPPSLQKDAVLTDAGSPSTPAVWTVTLARADTITLVALEAPYVASLFRTNGGSEDELAIGTIVVAENVRDDRKATT